jgi:flavin-dependent dehydrogenase
MNRSPEWDVIIRGGGLAGSAAAVLLARQGLGVLLVERSRGPHHKVCGEFLSPEALPVLGRLGLGHELASSGAACINSARITGADGLQASIMLPQPGWGLSRLCLDSLARQAAETAGAVVRRGATLAEFEGNPERGFTARDERGALLGRCRLALDASGKWSAARADHDYRRRRGGAAPTGAARCLIGLKAHFAGPQSPGTAVELYLVEGGYCGVSPVEQGLLNVCLLVTGRRLREAGSPDHLFAALRVESPPLDERLAGAERVQSKFLATAGLSYAASPLKPARVMQLGDAAGLIPPLTGDGMAMALRAAELVTPLAAACLDGRLTVPGYAAGYARAWNREFGGRRRWSGALHQLLAHPAAVQLLLGWIHRAPYLGQLLLHRTRGRFR